LTRENHKGSVLLITKKAIIRRFMNMTSTRQSSKYGKKITRHLLLPSIAPAALFGLYCTPKAVFGCANRGYMALGLVFLATIGAVVTTIKGVSERRRGESEAANWWLLTTLILLLPTFLLFGPLG
jgi:hypothetical protein